MQNDNQFLQQFESRTFPPERFDHRHHLWLAWIYLERYPLPEAVRRTAVGLKTFAESLGVFDKFHWTVTEALVRIMAARRRPDENFDAFLARNPELLADAQGLLRGYYSEARLADPAGRDCYLSPDLQEF